MQQNYYKYKVENLISIDSIVTMHNFSLEKGFVSIPEKHDFYEFAFVTKGVLLAIQDGNEVEVKQDEIIFHKPNTLHVVAAHKNTSPSILIVSFSSKSEEMRFFDNKKFTLSKDIIQILNIIFDLGNKTFDIDNTTPATKKMKLKDNAVLGGIQSIKNILEFFLIEIIKKERASNENFSLFFSGSDLIDNIIYYLKNNIYSKIEISDLCKRFGYSKSHIFKVFKRKTGQTIIDCFTHLKIEEAKKLLRKKENNISQVSSMLSFDNPNYFSKVFKKIIKMSPSDYRERHNIY